MKHTITDLINRIVERGDPPEVVDVPVGWVDIVWNLMDTMDITEIDYTVEQIKEKFGALRFYFNTAPGNWKIFDSSSRTAQTLSGVTCSICGEPGTRVVDCTYISVSCEQHKVT